MARVTTIDSHGLPDPDAGGTGNLHARRRPIASKRLR